MLYTQEGKGAKNAMISNVSFPLSRHLEIPEEDLVTTENKYTHSLEYPASQVALLVKNLPVSCRS